MISHFKHNLAPNTIEFLVEDDFLDQEAMKAEGAGKNKVYKKITCDVCSF